MATVPVAMLALLDREADAELDALDAEDEDVAALEDDLLTEADEADEEMAGATTAAADDDAEDA